jgi:hypothetical protein
MRAAYANVALSLFFAAEIASGQQVTDSNVKKVATAYEAVTFAVPESPAFLFLGTSPTKVARPASVHDLGAEILNGIGSDGRAKQGLAFEISPQFYVRTRVTLAQYQGSPIRYALAATRLSFGTVKSAGDTSSTDLALGIRIPIFDHGDPMRNKTVTDAIGKQLASCPVQTPEDDAIASAEACIKKGLHLSVKPEWNASRMAFAVVSGIRLRNSKLASASGIGTRAWLGVSTHAGTHDQLIFSATYRFNRAPTPDSTYHAASIGGRFNYGSERANAFVEAVGEQRMNRGVGVDRTSQSWTAGIEFRAADGVWVSTGFGTGYESAKQPDRVALLLGLRWGISAASRLAPN